MHMLAIKHLLLYVVALFENLGVYLRLMRSRQFFHRNKADAVVVGFDVEV
ncbi:hypothetical protein SBA3_4340008 [Candidatus Sulfopaludibacter sp. SbA3]|nr:hypothetical protein SBA3_4340008 [Candidatus Sulfopaludibacter sp. SbA3]